ncbi:MAG: EVE domain-containing protein [Phycisphaerales bacterium]|nr:EVE domain-containing protein [Phycisphaerales bacterium]
MNYWLVKSEPYKYSWEQFVKDKVTRWDGVRNYTARNYLKQMLIGDSLFFYHSNEGKHIVGIARVSKEWYLDPTATDGKEWVAIDIVPCKPLKRPVSLSLIKNTPLLKDMDLLKQSRLSVQRITPVAWNCIIKLSEE